MPNLLRLDASSRLTGSRSRDLGDYLSRRLVERQPDLTLVRRDLTTDPLQHIADETIAGFYTPPEGMTDQMRAATAISDELIDELQSADALLIATPMYNFGVPSALKAWIDQVVRINRTFGYDGQNFTGLVTGKPAYLALAYGAGGYAAGQLFSAMNFLHPYLDGLLRFLGFTEVHGFAVELTTADEPTVAANVASARAAIDAAIAPVTLDA